MRTQDLLTKENLEKLWDEALNNIYLLGSLLAENGIGDNRLRHKVEAVCRTITGLQQLHHFDFVDYLKSLE